MAQDYVNFKEGLSQDFHKLPNKNSHTLYWLLDTQQIFKGDLEFGPKGGSKTEFDGEIFNTYKDEIKKTFTTKTDYELKANKAFGKKSAVFGMSNIAGGVAFAIVGHSENVKNGSPGWFEVRTNDADWATFQELIGDGQNIIYNNVVAIAAENTSSGKKNINRNDNILCNITCEKTTAGKYRINVSDYRGMWNSGPIQDTNEEYGSYIQFYDKQGQLILLGDVSYGEGTFVAGENNIAPADHSFVAGGNNRSNAYAAVFGNGNIADYTSIVAGKTNIAGQYSAVFGWNNVDNGGINFIADKDNTVTGDSNGVIGTNNIVKGAANIVSGNKNQLVGSYNSVAGENHNIQGSDLIVSGDTNTVQNGSIASSISGNDNDVQASYSTISGRGIKGSFNNALIGGSYNNIQESKILQTDDISENYWVNYKTDDVGITNSVVSYNQELNAIQFKYKEFDDTNYWNSITNIQINTAQGINNYLPIPFDSHLTISFEYQSNTEMSLDMYQGSSLSYIEGDKTQLGTKTLSASDNQWTTVTYNLKSAPYARSSSTNVLKNRLFLRFNFESFAEGNLLYVRNIKIITAPMVVMQIGGGNSDTERSNIFTVYKDGSAEINKTGDTLNSLVTKEYADRKQSNLNITKTDDILNVNQQIITNIKRITANKDGQNAGASITFDYSNGLSLNAAEGSLGFDITPKGNINRNDLDMSQHQINNLGNPVENTDAVNKQYVDNKNTIGKYPDTYIYHTSNFENMYESNIDSKAFAIESDYLNISWYESFDVKITTAFLLNSALNTALIIPENTSFKISFDYRSNCNCTFEIYQANKLAYDNKYPPTQKNKRLSKSIGNTNTFIHKEFTFTSVLYSAGGDIGSLDKLVVRPTFGKLSDGTYFDIKNLRLELVPSNIAFAVGNGTSESDLNNALIVFTDGHSEIQKVGDTDNSLVTRKYVNDLISSLKLELRL